MSPILRFYSGLAPDNRGRTLAEIQAMSHRDMEFVHDFIQWMFPVRDPSAYNPAAPILTEADIAAFRASPELQANLRASFVAFLDFLGLTYADGAVTPSARFAERAADVFEDPNHNWLRITRVLLCLKTLGLEVECRALFHRLSELHQQGIGITPETFRYWKHAAAEV